MQKTHQYTKLKVVFGVLIVLGCLFSVLSFLFLSKKSTVPVEETYVAPAVPTVTKTAKTTAKATSATVTAPVVKKKK